MLGLSTVGQVTFIQLINQCAKRKKNVECNFVVAANQGDSR